MASRKASLGAGVQQRAIDKAVATALAKSGGQLALSGSYTGARIDRAQLSRWMPTAGSANSDTIRDLRMLRARSRDQMRNAPVALGALNTTVGHVVGTGLTYTPAIDGDFLGLSDDQAEAWQGDTKRRFNSWAASADCDVARQLDFYGLQELAFRTFLESGDAFVLTPRLARSGRTPRLALQLIEADRVCNPQLTFDSLSQIDGMEINPSTGEVIACQVARYHPGGTFMPGQGVNQWDRVVLRGPSTGRRNLLQIFKPLRPGQLRGVPWIAPILEPLKQLARWSDAELNAAVISGLMATFIKMDPTAFDMLYNEEAQDDIVATASKWSGEMESGKAINLLPGESIESPAPGRPNPAFDPFWNAMVRQIGMALEMPFEVLTMHFQSSYSAARAALLMAWKSFRSKRDLLSKMLCQPVLELWLADEVAEGRIRAPGFFSDEVVRAAWCASIWTGDGPGSIDPAKEVDAAQKRVDLGISTKQAESIAYDGVDWEQKHEQRVKEINAEKRDGIYFPPAGTAPMPQPVPVDDTANAIAALSSRVTALAEEPKQIVVNPPTVTINQGDTHNHIAGATVEGHEISVNLPEGCIQLEAQISAPTVQVDVQPSPTIIQQRHPDRQVHKRDSEGNLIETTNFFKEINHG